VYRYQLEALNMDVAFLNRNVNEGFSGGEKKRNEILQLACLEADCAILDEIDSGLDIDALRDVSRAVNGLKMTRPGMGVLMVTHYKVSRGRRSGLQAMSVSSSSSGACSCAIYP
jgi:Fe-S cluster assembly ATP-binding protein